MHNLTISITQLKTLFKKSSDIKFEMYQFGQQKVHFVVCEAMINQQLLYEMAVPRVKMICTRMDKELDEQKILTELYIPQLQKITDEQDAITLIFQGFLLIYFEENGLLLASNIESKPNRSPEETNLEVTIKGPRDNFIEDIATNVALIRKRLPTNSLCVERLEIGRRSKTAVAILYFDDIADQKILQQLKKSIQEIDTDIMFSGDMLIERINPNSRLLPMANTTGRADFAMQSLVRGRYVILMDGVSYAVITPVNLFYLLKSGEDTEFPVIFSSVERILRIIGIGIALLLPAFWLALTTFHQNQLPFPLLATVVQANTGLPLPSAVEMLLMILLFELFREASLRLPSAVGSTIGVVGGLIIGDAAIRAGVTSPAMVVIIALSTIATFTIANQSLVTAVSILRIVFVILAALFGLFGFYVSFYFLLIYLANIQVFGVPYLNIADDLKWDTVKKTFLRLPQKQYTERPEMLKPQDATRDKEARK